MSINPETLRKLRGRLSQDALAYESKVGKRTIARIESGGIDPRNVRNSTVKKLASALQCDPGDLEKAPDDEKVGEIQAARNLGYVPLQGYISAKAALDYELVQLRYNVSLRDIVELAPLAFLLLAEGSLAWRRKKVEAFAESAKKVGDMTGGHFSFVNAIYRAVDACREEEKSIAQRDLFGRQVAEDAYDLGYDPLTNNPFADYLRELAAAINNDVLKFDPDGIGCWRIGREIPEYVIDRAYLSELADDDYWAEYALKHRHVRIKEIPEHLMGDDAREARVAWLTEQLPPERRDEMRRRLDEVRSIALNLKGL